MPSPETYATMRSRLGAIAWWAVPALAAAAFAHRAWMLRYAWVDDSYIVLRYAWRLAHGQGLTWSSTLPPAEGYSDLLWVLWCALGLSAGIPALPWAIGSGLVFSTLTVLATAGLARAAGARRGTPALAAVLAAALQPTAWWATGGLEGPLFGLLLVVGLWRLAHQERAWKTGARPRPIAEALFALVSITHVSGPLMLACPLLLRWRHSRRVPYGRDDLLALAVLLGPLALQFAVRFVWLGDPLPTTYYAKFGIHFWRDTAEYLGLALAWNPALVALWVLGPLMGLRRRRAWLAWPGLLGLTYVLVVHSDGYMGQSRLLVPVLPAMCAAALAGLDALPSRLNSMQTWTLRSLALVLLLGAVQRSATVREIDVGDSLWTPRAAPYSWTNPRPRTRARPVPWFFDLLAQELGEGEAFFFSDVGQVGFMLPDNPVLDGRGLNWRSLAHLQRALVRGGSDPTVHLDEAAPFLADFTAAQPALVFLQCRDDHVFGFAESFLLTLPQLQERYRFLARGPYFGAGKTDTCVFARDDAEPPAHDLVRARYAHMMREDTLYAWDTASAAWERGERYPSGGSAPTLQRPGNPDGHRSERR